MTLACSRRARPPSDTRPCRIVLADDDMELRAVLASALRGDGYEVLEAKDGGRLLVQITGAYAAQGRDSLCDAIVSDVRMPVCSGVQILEGLRRAHWTTPVVLMTAFRDEPTRVHVESLGAVLLDKPFELDALRAVLERFLSGVRP
jgi:DNA-binding response OmpR family regulator